MEKKKAMKYIKNQGKINQHSTFQNNLIQQDNFLYTYNNSPPPPPHPLFNREDTNPDLKETRLI